MMSEGHRSAPSYTVSGGGDCASIKEREREREGEGEGKGKTYVSVYVGSLSAIL
jgi:hypothetical protein